MENSVQTLPFALLFVNQMKSLAQEVSMLMDANNPMYVYLRNVIMMVICAQFIVQESVEKMRSYAEDTLAQWDVKPLIFAFPRAPKRKEMLLEKTVQDIVPKSVIFMKFCALPKKIVTVV